MKTYEFDVILKDVSEVTDDQADCLFEAGCDEGSPAGCDGVAWIHFDKEAASLEEAIRQAVAQIQAAADEHRRRLEPSREPAAIRLP